VKILTRQDIVDAQDIQTETVEVPEWGGAVIVKMMSGAQRDQYVQSATTLRPDGTRETNMVNVQSRLVVMCAVDEQGNLLFGPDEVEHLGRKSAKAIERVFTVASRLNGLGSDDVGEAVKNSAPGPNGSSPSVSL
jgi:hypothetical protein